MQPLISVRGLSRRFGSGCGRCADSTGPDHGTNHCRHCGTVLACHDVCFDLYPDEALGVVGESGSGKSTLVRLLHFEWEASAGSVTVSRSAAGILPPEIFTGDHEYSRNLLGLSHFQKRQIRNAMIAVRQLAPGLDEDGVLRRTAEVFGIVRLGALVKGRLSAVYRSLPE